MKYIFKIIILFFSIIIYLPHISYSNTNKIESIDYTVKIKDNLDVEITEIWTGSFYIGTELFHFYENMNIDDIENFSVYENGEKYENLASFESYLSREEKTKKSSIKQTTDGIELCFGIGEKGYHKYKLNYILKNVFKNNELDLNILNGIYDVENINIQINGNFSSNVFTKIKEYDSDIVVKNNEIKYKLNNVNEKLTIYLNYDGLDNSIKKDKILVIKSKDKNKKIIILKRIIMFLIFVILIILIFLHLLNKRKVTYNFNSF